MKTIEVIYENGVFKPLSPVNLPEGTKGSVQLKSLDWLERVRERLERLPASKVAIKQLEELYYGGKVLR